MSGQVTPNTIDSAVILLAVAGVIVLVFYFNGRRRYDFVLKVRHGTVTAAGRAPPALRAAAADLFANDFPPTVRMTIFGRVRRDRSVILEFRGHLSAGDRQRIRNFLALHR